MPGSTTVPSKLRMHSACMKMLLHACKHACNLNSMHADTYCMHAEAYCMHAGAYCMHAGGYCMHAICFHTFCVLLLRHFLCG